MARITGIITPSRGSRVRLLELDGESWRTTAVDAVRSLGWREGVEETLDVLAASLDEAEAASARHRALRLLTARDRGVAELTLRLVDDGFPFAIGQRVVADLAAAGYMDDSRSARAYVRGQARVRGTGRTGIAARLRARGYDETLLAAALDDELPAGEELETVGRLADVYARDMRATVEKVTARLVRKGYATGIALRAAREAISLRDDPSGSPDGASDPRE